MSFKLCEEYIEFENNGFRLFNIISEKEYVLNDCAEIIYKNINKTNEEIISILKNTYVDIPKDINIILEEFKNNLVREFFYE